MNNARTGTAHHNSRGYTPTKEKLETINIRGHRVTYLVKVFEADGHHSKEASIVLVELSEEQEKEPTAPELHAATIEALSRAHNEV